MLPKVLKKMLLLLALVESALLVGDGNLCREDLIGVLAQEGGVDIALNICTVGNGDSACVDVADDNAVLAQTNAASNLDVALNLAVNIHALTADVTDEHGVFIHKHATLGTDIALDHSAVEPCITANDVSDDLAVDIRVFEYLNIAADITLDIDACKGANVAGNKGVFGDDRNLRTGA